MKNVPKTVALTNKISRWKKRVEKNGCIIKSMEILAVVDRGDDSFFTVFLDTQLATPEGWIIPRCVLIRGDSVVIIPILECEDNKRLYTMLVEQYCIANGSRFLGFAAGSVIQEEPDLRAMAHQETKEELTIDVPIDEFIPLSPTPIITNPSLTDDHDHYFVFRKKVTKDWLNKMNGKTSGCENEHEYTSIKIVTLEDANELESTSIIIGLRFLEKYLPSMLN